MANMTTLSSLGWRRCLQQTSKAGVGVVLLLFCLVISACDDVEDFTTDRSTFLQFSRDRIEFDTLITTVPSSTQSLVVYNRADKGLRITEVRLEGGAASPFRVNVTGQDLSRTVDNRATDFEIWRRDSMIVRLEVTLPDTNDDNPHRVSDNLLFTLESGIQQRVPLTVVGRDAYFYKEHTFTANMSLSGSRPCVVYGSMTVAEGVTLTLDAGAELLFHDGAELLVKGTVVANGTLEKPIVLRGDRTDHMFNYLPYDRLPGRWGGVTLAPTSKDNVLDYVDIHGGNYGIRCEASSLDVQKLKLTNSRLSQLGGDGLAATDCQLLVANTEISNTLGHCVRLLGADAQFIHCTLAQFYALKAERGYAISISAAEDGVYHPLQRADFINCVVTGYADDVVLIPALDAGLLPAGVTDPQLNYQFLSSMMATEVPPGDNYAARFQQIVFDAAGSSSNGHQHHFRTFNTREMIYDFAPVAASSIRGIADPAYAAFYPIDRRGHSRTADATPDAGCYEGE